MDDPVRDIHEVIHNLTQGSPQTQEREINRVFLPNASFTHPFCRTGSFGGSRLLIHAIFRWYKILSPRIELRVNSVALDKKMLLLYVNITQIFGIWFIPFHRSPVTLTTVLQLSHDATSNQYFIASQNDLYQVDQFVRFVAPWGIGTSIVMLWHYIATLFCAILALLGAPITWFEQSWADKHPNEQPPIGGGKSGPPLAEQSYAETKTERGR